jgi:hypothetical protein
MGMTISEVISAAANQGLSTASFTAYTFLNHRERSCRAIPEARPTKPRVRENLEICPNDLFGKIFADFVRRDLLLSEIGIRTKLERIVRPEKIKNVYWNEVRKVVLKFERKKAGNTPMPEPAVSARVQIP